MLLISCMGDREGPRILMKWSLRRRLPDEAAVDTSEGEGARPTPLLDMLLLLPLPPLASDSLGEDRVEEEGLFVPPPPLRPALCRLCGR